LLFAPTFLGVWLTLRVAHNIATKHGDDWLIEEDAQDVDDSHQKEPASIEGGKKPNISRPLGQTVLTIFFIGQGLNILLTVIGAVFLRLIGYNLETLGKII
jgi:hypothetical protein